MRVAVRVEPEIAAASLLEGGSLPAVALKLDQRNGEEAAEAAIEQEGKRPFESTIPLEPSEGRGSVELSTDEAPVGELELTLRIDATATLESLGEEAIEEVTVPEAIWVLDRGDYRKLVDERLKEPFLPSVGLPPEKVPDLVAELMHELLPIVALRHDFEDRLRLKPSKEQERLPIPSPRPHRLWPWEFIERVIPGDALFPEDPVRWVSAKLLGIVNELQVEGFSEPPRVELTVDASTAVVALQFDLSLASEITAPLAESLTDDELGDLAIIRRGAERAELEHTIEPGTSEVMIGLTLPTDGFPIEPATES